MLTIFSCPRTFEGHFGVIQRNAIRSWKRLEPSAEIILLGEEPGMAEFVDREGVRHIPTVERNEYGTPLLNSLFDRASAAASHDLLCYINADIILLPDFPESVMCAAAMSMSFLFVGKRTDLDITDELTFGPNWHSRLLDSAKRVGRIRPPEWIDYFVFRRGLFRDLPPFAVGRTLWDNWLLWDAIRRGNALIDATPAVTVVHQNHDYTHIRGAHADVWKGPEATTNAKLLGSPQNRATIADATHSLRRRTFRKRGAIFVTARHKKRYDRIYQLCEPLARRMGLKRLGLSRWLQWALGLN